MARKILAALLDLCKAAAIGAGAGIILGLLLAGIGYLCGGAGTALECAKNGLMMVSSALLLIVAGMLLIKGKKPENIRLEQSWRKHFSVLGPKSMLLALAAGMLAAASLADWLQLMYSMK